MNQPGAAALNRFVLDNSLTLSWYFEDERGPSSVTTLCALNIGAAAVPPPWPYEVAHGLLVGERRGRITPTDFHRQFKAVTTMSPLQFQKQLRLQEARRLLLGEHLDAASAGLQVGYDNASPFSRE